MGPGIVSLTSGSPSGPGRVTDLADVVKNRAEALSKRARALAEFLGLTPVDAKSSPSTAPGSLLGRVAETLSAVDEELDFTDAVLDSVQSHLAVYLRMTTPPRT